MLNRVPYGDNYGKRMQAAFYGLKHTPACGDGEIYDCRNLTSECFPLIAPRRPRGLFKTLTKANGFAGRDVLMWVDGTDFFYNGTKKGEVVDSFKSFCFLGVYVIIWPDKVYYDTRLDEFGSLEETYISGAGEISFQDGTFAGETAKANSIATTGKAFDFEIGDAVTITECADVKNNMIPIIREISEDKKTLRFYENSFHITSGTGYTEAGAITIARKIPDMDFICEHENRLWGCRGDDIYCSNLGNPKVWMNYEGVASGSWSVAVGTAGDFSGCVSFMGYAIFMKDDSIHKVYGDVPEYFKAMQSATMGVKSGCNRSFAIAGETLFYRSRAGIVRYNGGYPYLIDDGLGRLLPDNCVAGTDGRNYYISGTAPEGDVFLCYDTVTKLWLRLDDTKVSSFAWAMDGLYYLSENKIWKIAASHTTTPEEKVVSFAEFGDFYEASPNRKGVKALQIRAEVPDDATLSAYIKCDSEDTWQKLGDIKGTKKTMHFLPMIPRRCDYFRLKLCGTGDWRVYSIAREFYEGSDLH